MEFGDTFAEVVDTSRAIVDVALEDADAGLLRVGERASVKLNSFPTRVFRGDVTVVSPKGALQGDVRVFFARVALANPDGTIRAGMEGRSKVRARVGIRLATRCSDGRYCGFTRKSGRGLEFERIAMSKPKPYVFLSCYPLR